MLFDWQGRTGIHKEDLAAITAVSGLSCLAIATGPEGLQSWAKSDAILVL